MPWRTAAWPSQKAEPSSPRSTPNRPSARACPTGRRHRRSIRCRPPDDAVAGRPPATKATRASLTMRTARRMPDRRSRSRTRVCSSARATPAIPRQERVDRAGVSSASITWKEGLLDSELARTRRSGAATARLAKHPAGFVREQARGLESDGVDSDHVAHGRGVVERRRSLACGSRWPSARRRSRALNRGSARPPEEPCDEADKRQTPTRLGKICKPCSIKRPGP